MTSSGSTVRTRASGSWPSVAPGSDADALQAVEPSDAISSRTSMTSDEPGRTDQGLGTGIDRGLDVGGRFGAGLGDRVRDRERTLEHAATVVHVVDGESAAAFLAAEQRGQQAGRRCEESELQDPRRSTRLRWSEHSPRSSLVAGTVLSDDESSSLLHPATITAAATSALTGRIHLLRPMTAPRTTSC